MDEHLCRGKRADDKEWMFGYFMQEPSGRTLISAYSTLAERWDWAEVDPSTTGRCTGLTDKNGMKIFEGDILRTKYGRLCYVSWFNGNATLRFDLKPICNLDNLLKKAPDKWDLWNKENLEVIGSIHDNPELLEEKS